MSPPPRRREAGGGGGAEFEGPGRKRKKMEEHKARRWVGAAAAVPLYSSEPTNLTRRALRGSHCDQQECRLTPTAIQHHPLRALSSRQ